MGTVCIVSLPSLVYHCWDWFALFHSLLQLFIINGHCLYCITSLTGSSLLGMVCVFALPSLVRSQRIKTMTNNDEYMKHEVKQYKTFPAMMKL
jgi:hypothetical protein